MCHEVAKQTIHLLVFGNKASSVYIYQNRFDSPVSNIINIELMLFRIIRNIAFAGNYGNISLRSGPVQSVEILLKRLHRVVLHNPVDHCIIELLSLIILSIHSISQIINICSISVDGHDTIFNFSGNMDSPQFRKYKIGVFSCEPDLQIFDLVPFARLAAEMRPCTIPITYITVFYVFCSPTDNRVFMRALVIIKRMKYLIPFCIIHFHSI